MGEFLMQCHRGLRETEAMPWVFHDFWLRDMDHSAGEASLHRAPSGIKAVRYAFFPGCQMGASDPQYVKDCYSWLLGKQPDSAIWLNCCGAPAAWAAENEMHAAHIGNLRSQWRDLGSPAVVFACPTCRKMFRRYLPEIEGVFIEELMNKWGMPECGEISSPDRMAVFDPCGSRDFPELQDAVRKLADELGVACEELSHTGDLARCCSFGGQYSRQAEPAHTGSGFRAYRSSEGGAYCYGKA